MSKNKLNAFFRNTSIIVLILSFFVILFFDNIFITIPSGHIGVLYELRTGTDEKKIYPEGLEIISPLNTMHIYDARKQLLSLNMSVLSNDGLNIKVTVDTRFRPLIDSLGVIHKQLGPNYIDVVLKSEIESSVRKVISSYTPEELYTINRAEIENEISKDSKEEFGRDDIIVDDIMIIDIALPEMVSTAIEKKLTEQQNLLSYEYLLQSEKQEAKRKLIEAEGIKKFTEESGISILTWKGIDATVELAKSNNAKVVVVGSDSKSLPIIMNMDSQKQ